MFASLSDQELVEKIQSNEEVSGCLSELQNRHSGIFHQKINQFDNIPEVQDLKENNLSFFYEVATSFDPERSIFPTYLGNKTYWQCQNYNTKYHKNYGDFHCEIDNSCAIKVENFENKELYDFASEFIKNEEDRRILILSMEGHTLQEISDKLGNKYTREWIRVKKKNTLRSLRTALKKEMI